MKAGRIPRVLHIPYHTPYVRKLSALVCKVVNGNKCVDGCIVPDYATLGWLARQLTFDFFDLIHIHFFETEPIEVISQALKRCAEERKAIVFTAHDLSPVFNRDEAGFKEKMSALCSASHAVVALTPQSSERLRCRFGVAGFNQVTVIPHGFVLHPEHERARSAGSRGDLVEFAMFGSLRSNRATYVALANWLMAVDRSVARMNLLLRPLGPEDPEIERVEWRALLSLLQRAENIRAVMLPIPDDNVLAAFLVSSDVLVMPYAWGTHSGQLELAFDLGIVPVITNVGFYASQWEYARAHVQEPIWVDWTDGARHLYGSRLIEAFSLAMKRVAERNRPPTADEFKGHRLSEHELILEAYQSVYSSSMEAAGTFG